MHPLPLLALLLLMNSLEAAPRKGWMGMVLPIPSYTSDNGIGYGAFGALSYRGQEEMGGDPYQFSLEAEYFATTKGYQDHFGRFDLPSPLGLPVRWFVELGYQSWAQAGYFGQGNELPRLPVDQTPDQFYQYGLESMRGYTTLRVQVRGPWEVFGGWSFRDAQVDVYPGSLLAQEQPDGALGGLNSQLVAGLVHDSRDRELSPSEGVFSDVSLMGGAGLWGSEYRYGGLDLTDRRWYSILSERRLVIANRVIADLRLGDVPFFEQWKLGGLEPAELGGSGTLRGLPIGRYRADLVLLSNTELRWMFWDFDLWFLHADVLAVPFVDLGRFFLLDSSELSPSADPGWASIAHLTGGLGMRIELNESFAARADLGFSREDYLYTRPDGSVERDRGLVYGLSMLADHPF